MLIRNPYPLFLRRLRNSLKRHEQGSLHQMSFKVALVSCVQSGILAVGRGNQVVEPVFGDDGIEKPGVMKIYITLSADHRVFYGEVAGAFLAALKSNFSDIRRLLI